MSSTAAPPSVMQHQHQRYHRLIVLCGIGGLSDVGRHVVQVAHDLQLKQREQPGGGADVDVGWSQLKEVVVITKHPDLLLKDNWNCGCNEPHSLDLLKATGTTTTSAATAGAFTSTTSPPIRIVKVDDWKDPTLHQYFATSKDDATTTTTTTSVVSCVGNRQTIGHNEAAEAMENLILPAMNKNQVQRLVIMTSVGVEEDWPPLEFFGIGRCALSCMFLSTARRAFKDLTKMEQLVKATPAPDAASNAGGGGIDYLLVRPVGIGEDVKPTGQWQLQREKYKDVLDFNMAKLDVARFMLREAMLKPTLHRTAVVIGGVKDPSQAVKWEE